MLLSKFAVSDRKKNRNSLKNKKQVDYYVV